VCGQGAGDAQLLGLREGGGALLGRGFAGVVGAADLLALLARRICGRCSFAGAADLGTAGAADLWARRLRSAAAARTAAGTAGVAGAADLQALQLCGRDRFGDCGRGGCAWLQPRGRRRGLRARGGESRAEHMMAEQSNCGRLH
jgi:hypothetical protein